MYDARSSSGDSANLVFGVATLVVVGLAFALAWFGTGFLSGNGSGGAGGSAFAAEMDLPSDTHLAQTFASPAEQRLLTALAGLDSRTYRKLEADFESVSDRDQQIELVGMAAGKVLLDNAEHLAHVSAADLNGMLDSASDALTKIRATNRELCLGSTYARFENMNPLQAQREAERLFESAGMTNETVHAMSVASQADFLEMLVRTKANPVRHGKLTPQDETALQGLLMTFMTDPAFMELAMADSQQDALARLNICDMGLKVLHEVRGLPDGTKARAWATMFDQPEFRKGLREAQNFSF